MAPGAGGSAAPHDCTTWAAIAGMRGRETNRFYARLDDNSVLGFPAAAGVKWAIGTD